MRSFKPVKEQSAIPKQVDQIKQWLNLLRLEYVILVDSRDGGYTFLLPITNCPDIHVALENNFAYITFFSNGLTCLSQEPDEVVHTFLRKVMILQSKYFTSRIVTTGSKEDLRLYLGFRFSEMNMYRFSRKIRELIQFVKEVAQLIDEHKMNEIWRDTEQEPKFPTIDISERIRFL